jgi:hypothetical protein
MIFKEDTKQNKTKQKQETQNNPKPQRDVQRL